MLVQVILEGQGHRSQFTVRGGKRVKLVGATSSQGRHCINGSVWLSYARTLLTFWKAIHQITWRHNKQTLDV